MYAPHLPRPASATPSRVTARRGTLFMILPVLMLVLALVTSLAVAPAAAAQEADSGTTATDVAEQISGSAVTVYTYTPGGMFSPGRTGREPSGAGSGWVYSDDGVVITNHHVITDAEEILVVLGDGTQIPATLIGSDWYQDVAVLRLEPESNQELPPAATIGDSSQVRAGDEVIAIGTPLGQFANTVSVGHVGATGRTLNTGVGYSLLNLIQHDATISPGNSGGPLVSMDGEVIGMNVARVNVLGNGQQSPDDISLAIDGNTVVSVAEEIIEHGSVAHPYLGITTQVTGEGSARVSGIERESPAGEAGIQQGDVITDVDGERVTGARPLIDLLYQYDPGDTVTLTVERDDDAVEVEVELGGRSAGL